MDRLTTTTRLLENSRSTIYTSGHSTGRGTRGRPWIWITYFYSEKQWKLQCTLISPECVQYIHKSKYSIFFCYQFLHITNGRETVSPHTKRRTLNFLKLTLNFLFRCCYWGSENWASLCLPAVCSRANMLWFVWATVWPRWNWPQLK